MTDIIKTTLRSYLSIPAIKGFCTITRTNVQEGISLTCDQYHRVERCVEMGRLRYGFGSAQPPYVYRDFNKFKNEVVERSPICFLLQRLQLRLQYATASAPLSLRMCTGILISLKTGWLSGVR
jgi:hypothetical protein